MKEKTIAKNMQTFYSRKLSGNNYWDTRGIVHNRKQLSKIIDYQSKLINTIIIQVINLSILFSMIVVILIIIMLRK